MSETNEDLYRTKLLGAWSKNSQDELDPAEKYFLDKYLIETTAPVVEAGAGGGRLSFYLARRGFKSLLGFDQVAEMAVQARHNALTLGLKTSFECMDATHLPSIESGTFQYAIYLAQILSFVPEEKIPSAVRESFRILKPGGTAVFSVLYYWGRPLNLPLHLVLGIRRLCAGRSAFSRGFPWLRLAGAPNWRLFQNDQATVHWFFEKEIIALLRTAGFEILESKTSSEVGAEAGIMRLGNLYIAARKPDEPHTKAP
jgi:SAM-dependent methyltransferase